MHIFVGKHNLTTLSRIASTYTDNWDGDILLYTGMGQKEDQSLTFAQNKTLAESNSNGVTVHLFEVFQRKIYTYYGIVRLVKPPYLSEQKDTTGTKRNVYIFPLQRIY